MKRLLGVSSPGSYCASRLPQSSHWRSPLGTVTECHARLVGHWALVGGAREMYVRTHSTPPPSPSLLRPRRGGLERSSPRPEAISQVPGESGLAPALEPPWVRTRFSIPKNAFVAIASWSSLAILLHGCAEIVKQFGDPRSWPPCYDNGLGVNLMLKWWRLSQGSRPRAESAGGACFSWRRFCCRAARIFGSSHVARACLARTSWTEL